MTSLDTIFDKLEEVQSQLKHNNLVCVNVGILVIIFIVCLIVFFVTYMRVRNLTSRHELHPHLIDVV
jgi:signal transduction histidine kinase